MIFGHAKCTSGFTLAILVAWAQPALSEVKGGNPDYFSGKTMTVQVPSGAGGTYHIYCQIVVRHIGKHIPGHPQVVIQNMPGAGGAKSAAYMANVAPKDGTMIAMIAPGTITTPLVRDVKFDARKFNWLGAVAARPAAIWIWHTHKAIRSIEDAKTREVTIASTGFSSAGSVFPNLVNEVLGTRFRVILGYKGGGALDVAVERGEAMGRWNYYSGFTGVRPDWIPNHKIIPILAMGPRHPKMKDVPHLEDILKKGTIERRMYEVLGMNLEVGQAFYAPPGVSPGPVAVLKKAFADMIADPATEKEIIERRVEFSPKSADEVVAEIARGFAAADAKVVERLRKLFRKEGS